jgi:hypothetical protein
MPATEDLELTHDEIVALIEREAHRRYGLSAAAFVAQYRDGTFDECGGAADLVALARMLPEGDPLYLAA